MYICKMYSDSFPQKVSEYSLLRHDKYYTILQVCSQTKKSQSCIVIAKEWSPGLVVMGDDSCSRGRGFKFRHHILDGHDIFSHQFVVKIVVCLKRPKINEKEAGFKKEWCPNGPRRGEPLEKDMNISIITLNQLHTS